ncbi:MBL fold metallo-hydrolase [Pseudomonas syringae]|uniref:MBL fold metallo-hydrolase n=1 Tax=Pseudomonas syringae TaxID=317 RepID=UPI0018E6103B|nr:MBL fold metallo-hydrolase [Pseudomonas syringae]MBI6749038.1 MBL fold metallo-hydrolase [Pseudomonas syringae]MBI6771078.1 MBL fold metallo-hydrolase [Pseudomonas syringae]MBI6777636.1 MBL fold metallo-hydrolase [Pseudomonas syringae]MBI6792326.1 MBL fold metallo-hydrolase [Pseudomonas syringae]MBI6802857.1 MBL fold metallo-hydrolase [Pseudomonas syringae]
MKTLKTLVIAIALAAGTTGLTHAATSVAATQSTVQVQQIRNATAKIDYAGKTFLVDPFLAKKGTYPGFPDTFHSELRNPTVELPLPVKDILNGVDAVIVTHTHLDHWDGGDQNFIPKAIPLFVQNEADAKVIRDQGYTNVRIMTDSTEFEGVHLTKTGGRHGTEEMYSNKPLGDALGEAMGVVFEAPGAKTVYIVGDTVWNSTVDSTLSKFKPDVIILNTGEARMRGYTGAIIMGKDDVLHAWQVMPNATIIATHMDAINHMTLSRKELRDHVNEHKIGDRVRIPADGEVMKF